MTTNNPTPVSHRATAAVFALLSADAVGGRVTGLPVSRIAEATGYATRTVERALQVLRETGRITGGQTGVGGVAEYVIVTDELREVA